MAVDSNRGGLVGENGRFPVGMRVLAVDDDKTCLEILETMLRKCQYQVTTARHAKDALKMLRENRHKYDLVITDVQMPDTNGFQLLEIVGLEMDLPVIMLSDYSDTELVMKGVTHGACDYLSKPVRIEELKNIWQHVVRRFKPKDQIINLVSQGPNPIGLEETGLRKRKDHSEEGDGEEEDGAYNDGSSRQKKRRVVWSQELQQKFVEAVNHLGFDKAVPKKILNLMNVEGLSRENVASHLQKFRIGLKKLQAEKPALGHGFGGCHSSGGPGWFSNSSLPSYPPGVTHASLIQPSHSQALNNCFGNSPTLFRGVPPSLELKELDSFTCGSSNPISNFPTNHLMNRCAFGNQSSFRGVELVNFPQNSSPWSVPCDASNNMFQPNSFNGYFSPNYGMNNTLRTNEEFLHGRIESHDGFMESIDDLVNTLDKRGQSSTTLLDSESIWV